MSWTKRQIIELAFDEIGILGYEFDVSPEEDEKALRRLDSMMGTYDGMGIHRGYNLSSSVDGSDLDDDSGLSDTDYETAAAQLAIRLAPGYGKTVSSDTKRTARQGLALWKRDAAFPPRQQLPDTMPRGAGNKPWGYDNPFMPPPDTDPLQVGPGGDLEIA